MPSNRLTEPSPDPSFSTPQRTRPTPDRCSTLASLCDECKLQKGGISDDVRKGYLVCPKGAYPVILTFEFFGTRDKARESVQYCLRQVMGMFNLEGDAPVYGAVRRPNGTDGPGSWHDVTTPGAKSAEPFKPNRGLFTLPEYKGPIEAAMRADYAKRTSQVRQVSILADLPFPISPNGEIETMMLRDFLPSWGQKKAMQHPNAGHPSVHRLKWWADTHPHAEPKEPERQRLNPDPWKRPNVQVRKKKY